MTAIDVTLSNSLTVTSDAENLLLVKLRLPIDVLWLGERRPFCVLERAPANIHQFTFPPDIVEHWAIELHLDRTLKSVFTRSGSFLLLEPQRQTGEFSLRDRYHQSFENGGYKITLALFESDEQHHLQYPFEKWVQESIELLWKEALKSSKLITE